eukprot:XP_025980853.1 uncharacterized protein LOC100784591 isoform X2 [Glycine max]
MSYVTKRRSRSITKIGVVSSFNTCFLLLVSNSPSLLVKNHHNAFHFFHNSRTTIPETIDTDFLTKKKKQVSVQLPSLTSPVSTVRFCDLNFGRLQPSDDELDPHNRFEFGNFVARQALLHEEYWTAAWLRAEEWASRTHKLYVVNHKRNFADQEFDAIKKRCKEQQDGQSSTCIITVRKQDKNVKRSIISSVVGTLDLNIRYLRLGETFPGEPVDAPRFCKIERTPSSRYGYIANLCVAKSVRRKGIASNMLYFAVESAKSSGNMNINVWHMCMCMWTETINLPKYCTKTWGLR